MDKYQVARRLKQIEAQLTNLVKRLKDNGDTVNMKAAEDIFTTVTGLRKKVEEQFAYEFGLPPAVPVGSGFDYFA